MGRTGPGRCPGWLAWPRPAQPRRHPWLPVRPVLRRCVIAADPTPYPAPSDASWSLAEAHVAEDDVLAAARARAAEVGITPVSPGTGAALRLLAAVLGARAVVEVGTGTGVSGLWLLRGMAPDGVLTSVDIEGEHHRLARETFADEGVGHNKVRLISGRALDVLPRLTDGGYDLVLIDGDKTEYDACLDEALRLLRPGGVVAVDNALWHDRVADPAQRDPDTVAIRLLERRMANEPRLTSALLSVGDGLLVGVRRADDDLES